MNLEIIDKWLDNEFGVSYTRLEELHDFVINQDLKHQEKADKEIERLNNIIDELEKWCLSWKENDKYCYLASNDKDKCRYDIWKEVLDKLNELKGDNK